MGKENTHTPWKQEVCINFLQYTFCFPFCGIHNERLWLCLSTFCLEIYIRNLFSPKNLNTCAKCKKIKLNLLSGRWQRNRRQTFTWSDTVLCEKCRKNRYSWNLPMLLPNSCLSSQSMTFFKPFLNQVPYLFIPSQDSTSIYKIHTLIASTDLTACQA